MLSALDDVSRLSTVVIPQLESEISAEEDQVTKEALSALSEESQCQAEHKKENLAAKVRSQEVELAEMEAVNARLREEVDGHIAERIQLEAELQRQDRRTRRQERERLEWDWQEAAVKACEERLASLSEICASRRKAGSPTSTSRGLAV